METVIEEADETLFWLEILEELNLLDQDVQHPITTMKQECNELVSIFVASVKTVKSRLRQNPKAR
jgi:four helix bundle protein